MAARVARSDDLGAGTGAVDAGSGVHVDERRCEAHEIYVGAFGEGQDAQYIRARGARPRCQLGRHS